ncbi:hypothetical protein COCSUDRAFT_63276 [Coccomyxa subellipsoidea C-169]|uniref:Thioredoxin domain-containing protein n=1 Tax=Coccomyxa subellipsoidea (strain C-169) TaxID=574566 RepID=I0YZD3_COCSC|nr:hypothetical protein COCSUDRAFT_63276 [Coccomyxa subellipsoidea C-169]EIE23752.1 hypothetical protein COCSUDRAFT_63276 [Coccomyxa subellipsoidea C-169]|eukprot:XP_005648296.1 hypothetical protein COCSUDRAFT_63276 [Coccomyxa subellipsoidea C-169]
MSDTRIATNVAAARTDDELRSLLLKGKDKTHPEHKYVVAQVDSMKDALQGIRYTPTFAVYRKGRKVDQFFGPSPQQLRDRVWLQSDDPRCGSV